MTAPLISDKTATTSQRLFNYFSHCEETFFFLNNNQFIGSKLKLNTFEKLFAAGIVDEIKTNTGALDSLQLFINKHNGKWIFGYLSYDAKNEIEKLKSNNFDRLDFPILHFVVPETVIVFNDGYRIYNQCSKEFSFPDFEAYFEKEQNDTQKTSNVQPKARITKQGYIEKINKIKEHIQYGDVYELTFCQEFFAEDAIINPAEVYEKLNKISPAPFSCYYRSGQHHLMSSSPERFLCKTGKKIYSQPIKGTIRRSENATEDDILKQQLLGSEKERTENVMIVDLVRNDLSRIAKRGSIKVEELFGVYSFSTVHQMISTICCELKEEKSFTDIIKATFPMGSMTGAPKVKALELIEQYEETKRGLFSGTIGYIDPVGNFDFNVVIRSILYNAEKKYASIQTGGAITIGSDAEKEYEESLLKAQALIEALKN
jgi:para-aminobenzoate synthetase component I